MDDVGWIDNARRMLADDCTIIISGPLEDPVAVARWRGLVVTLLVGILLGTVACSWIAWRGWGASQQIIELLEQR